MTKRLLILSFPAESLSEPIIYTMSQQFNLVTNIIRANIEAEEGWALLELKGMDEDIENGMAWAISKGVRVERVNEEISGTQ